MPRKEDASSVRRRSVAHDVARDLTDGSFLALTSKGRGLGYS